MTPGRLRGRVLVALTSVGLLATVPVAQQAQATPQTYTIESLGVISDLPNTQGSYALAANSAGQVVGSSETDTFGQFHAFLWDQSRGMIDLGQLGTGLLESNPEALNGSGDVAGYSCVGDSCDANHAFIWTPSGGMQDLGTLGGNDIDYSVANDINDNDLVVGASYTSTDLVHAFVWDAGHGMTDIGTLGGSYSQAAAVNDAGQVVGSASTAGGETHAFVWDAAHGMVDLGVPGGGTFSAATTINASGTVGGSYDDAEGNSHAFVWDPVHGMQDIGSLGGSTNIRVLTDAGVALGAADLDGTAERYHAFVWTRAGGLHDLGTFGGDTGVATGIDQAGDIVGSDSLVPDGQSHAFVWNAADGLQDLGTLGGNSANTVGVSASGMIVGTSRNWTGSMRAVRWFPGPQGEQTPPTVDAISFSRNPVPQGLNTVLRADATDDETGVASGEYFIDNDPGPGNATPMTWNGNDLSARLGGLAEGTHTIGVRALDANHNWSAAVTASLVVTTPGNPGPAYTLVDLGTLGGTDSSVADLNDAGQVTGQSDTSSGATHTFRYSGGTMHDLGTLGGTSSYGLRINASGQVAGTSYTHNGHQHAFRATGATMTDLGTLGGTDSGASDINDNGDVVGYSITGAGELHPFAFRGGSMTDLGTLPDGNEAYADRINDAGVIIGHSNSGPGSQFQGFVDNGSSPTPIGELTPGLGSWAININDAGEVVGYALTDTGTQAVTYANGTLTQIGQSLNSDQTLAQVVNASGDVAGTFQVTDDEEHAFLDLAGAVTDIGSPYAGSPSYLSPTGINDNDDIVGDAGDSHNNSTGWLYTQGTMWDLNDLITSPWTVVGAEAINRNGLIAADATNDAGHEHAVLLVPSSQIDSTPPTITVTTPGSGTPQYSQGQVVNADYACADEAGGSGLASCTGDVPNGQPIDTSAVGSFTFTVNATDNFGNSASASRAYTVVAHPDPPANVVAAGGDMQAAVSWSVPSSDGGMPVTSYTVTASPGGQEVTTADGATTSATVAGLTDGTTYTFTVSATNAVGTSDPSSPSDAVTPASGAPAPVAISAPVNDQTGGTVSTGTDTTPTQPVNTSVDVPAGTGGGEVSVAEGTVTEAPPSGYQFLDTQQVNIDSTADTTPTNPLRITFTIDGSQLNAETPSSLLVFRTEAAGAPTLVPACTADPSAVAAPDPCIPTSSRNFVNGTDAQFTVVTSSASVWNVGILAPIGVRVSDKGYAPAHAVVSQGQQVRWTFSSKKLHSVTDSLGLGAAGSPLFDSSMRSAGAFTYRFSSAGTYSYRSSSSRDHAFRGSIAVPLQIQAGSIGVHAPVGVTWSSSTGGGFVFDVRYRFRRNSSARWSSWTTWESGTALASATFTPAKTGIYGFSARLRNLASGKASLYSPAATIKVV